MARKKLFPVLLAVSLLLVPGFTGLGFTSHNALAAVQNGTGYEKPSAKARYEAKAKRRIRDYQMKIDRLKEKAQREAGEAKIKGKAGIKELQAKLDTAKLKLKKLEGASSREWRKAKSDMDKALAEVHSEYKKAVSYFK